MGEPIPAVYKNLVTELTDFAPSPGPDDAAEGLNAGGIQVDALIVGAGFAGIFMLKTLRDRGLKTVIFEAGNDIGGTWRWNCYPGAAVDSEVPEYEFSWPEIWKTWSWSSNYPSYQELRAYFDHVDHVLNIKKDCAFHSVVIDARFDLATANFCLAHAAKSAKRYTPDWPGMDTFRGTIHHSSFWPEQHVDVRNKRCAVIGTGASGVQIIQAWGSAAGNLTVFQRTPNLALPMRKRVLSAKEQKRRRECYPELFRYRETTYAGFHYDWSEKSTFDDNPEERESFYDQLWEAGGFRYWIATYKDNFFVPASNKESYDFWAKKTRARIGDAKKRDLLAPLQMPHYFGVKRPCLEHDYYEQFNRESVDVVDIKANPIKEFRETGITLEDGMTQLGLQSIHGTSLRDEWATGANTYLGTTVRGYPNMFHLYGAHGPTLLSNGPSCVEVQGRWIADMINKMETGGIKYINPKAEAVDAWKQRVLETNNITLIPTTTSTYMGGNFPGKLKEPVCYAGGIPEYAREIRQALDAMEGFEVVYA
ncbi:hypothetical protein RJ55_02012 [Drechmeria coniospora]|nr:hypothetical protein RJ55_02012 [Drechmeria coniospora]